MWGGFSPRCSVGARGRESWLTGSPGDRRLAGPGRGLTAPPPALLLPRGHQRDCGFPGSGDLKQPYFLQLFKKKKKKVKNKPEKQQRKNSAFGIVSIVNQEPVLPQTSNRAGERFAFSGTVFGSTSLLQFAVATCDILKFL